jgi:GH25 family lysozyme M1 (1,4-beta-N-acetylmuramidase)
MRETRKQVTTGSPHVVSCAETRNKKQAEGRQVTIFGPDCSSFQGVVDWHTVAQTCAFGWEKATEGTGYTNPRWAQSRIDMLAEARASGFIPGVYMFLDYGDGAAQADYFAQACGDLTGFAIAIDGEAAPNGNPTLAQAEAAVARLRQHYPGHPIIGYDPSWYWGGQTELFVDVLWASRYVGGSGSPAQIYPNVPASFWAPYGGRTPALLQFTNSATIPGISGPVDCSAFRGTAAELGALILPDPPPPPRKDADVYIVWGQVHAYLLSGGRSHQIQSQTDLNTYLAAGIPQVGSASGARMTSPEETQFLLDFPAGNPAITVNTPPVTVTFPELNVAVTGTITAA